MVRELDLKKPPSIAESIDWARALLLLGAEDIDQQHLPRHALDHRQAPHRPRHGRRAGRRAAHHTGVSLDGHLIGFADALRTEGVAIGTSELNDAFAALGEVEWTRPGPFKEALAATLAKSPDDRRVFDLVFERYFFRATEGAALEAGVARGQPGRRAGHARRRPDRLRRAARADPRGDPRRRRGRPARPRPPRDRRLRPPRRGLRRARRRRPAHPTRARA